MANIGTLMAHLGVDTSDLKRAERELKSSTGNMERGISSLNSSFASLSRTLIGVFSIYEIAQYSKEVIMLADNYTLLRNQVKLVTSSDAELSSTMEELQKIAADTWGDLETTVLMYSRMARAAKALGIDEGELIGITKTLNETIAISGASSIEAKNALIQFSQGLQSNRLSGEELRAVMEQLPGLAMQIAKGMEIPYGQLKLMAQEGKVDARAVVDALIKQRDEIHSMFQDMDITIGYAMTNIKTNFGAVVDDINRGLSGTGSIAESFQWFADLLREFHESGAATEWAYAMSDAFSAFSLGLMDTWSYAEYGLKVGFEGIRYQWDLIISGMQETFANYVNFVAAGYSKIPFIGDKLAETWINVTSGLRTTGEAVSDHEKRLAGLRGELDKNLSVTDGLIDKILEERSVSNKASESVRKFGDNISNTNIVTEEAKKAADKHAKALESVLDKYLPMESAIEDMNKEQALLNELHEKGVLVGERYTTAMNNFTSATKMAEYAASGLTEAMMDTGQSFDVMQSEFQQGQDVLRKEIEDTSELVKSDTDEMGKYIEERWKEAFDGMQNILADWIKNGEVSFDSILDLFKNMLAEMLAAWIMNMGKMVLADLFSGVGGIGGLIGGLFGGSSSGGGVGSAASILGTLGTAYEWMTGTSVAGTVFGGTTLPAAMSGVSVGGSVYGGTASTGVIAGGGSVTAPTAGTSTGAGSGLGGWGATAMTIAPFAIGIGLWARQMLKEDVPPLAELLNQQGIGPEYFANVVGDQLTNAVDPIYGTINGFMMDFDSLILTRTRSMAERFGIGFDNINDYTLQYFDATTGQWRDLSKVVTGFGILQSKMGRDSAAAFLEAQTGLVGLAEELINISEAQKTSVDTSIDSMDKFGLSGIEMSVVFSEVQKIIQGTTKDTNSLKFALDGFGLSAIEIDTIIKDLGLDAIESVSGMNSFKNTIGTLDYELGDVEQAIGTIANSFRASSEDMIDAANDMTYTINDILDGLTEQGNDYQPPGNNYSSASKSASNIINLNVTIPGTDLINETKLKKTISVISDNIRVTADKLNLKGKQLVF